MEILPPEARLALRRLVRDPAYTVTAVITLGLAVAANGVILAVLHASLLQPVVFPEPDQLVDILATRQRGAADRFGISPADFLAWRERSRSFEHFGGYVPFGYLDLTGDGDPERLRCHYVTAAFFRALGVPPLYGRTFCSDEEETGQDRVLVLSHGFWRRRFGGDPGLIGKALTLNGEAFTVVGVMPFRFGARGGLPDVWVPLSFGSDRPADRSSHYLGVIARLTPGVSLHQARLEMDAIADSLALEHPETNKTLTASLLPLAEVMVRGLRAIAAGLGSAAFLVLLIARLNVAGLELARSLVRSEELALRAALGAGRWHLVYGSLLERVWGALAGGILGLSLSALVVKWLPDLRGSCLHAFVEPEVNLWVLVVTLSLTLFLALVFGLAGALATSRIRIGRPFASGRCSCIGAAGSQRLFSAMVMAQIALSVALLAGAGLMVRSLRDLGQVELGYRPEGILTLDVSPPASMQVCSP